MRTPHPASMPDTNIIIYMVDTTDPARFAAADALMSELTADDALLLSVQTLNELYRNLVFPKVKTGRPNRAAFSHEDAITFMEGLVASARAVVALTPDVCLRGYRIANRHSVQLWDAIVLSSVIEAGAAVLYTEDVPSGVDPKTGLLEGIRYINPFAP